MHRLGEIIDDPVYSDYRFFHFDVLSWIAKSVVLVVFLVLLVYEGC